jgi:serine protease Do
MKDKSMTKRVWLAGLLTLCMAAAGVGSHSPLHAQSSGAAAVRGLPDFADLAEQNAPSVVNIRTSERVVARSPGQGGGPSDEDMAEFFRRFFGVPMPNVPRQGPQNPQRPQPNQPGEEQERPRGVGSGFFITGDGFILTNAHVVDGADEVIVTLTDKRELKARIVGADRRTDVAVVKVEGTGFPAVKIGDVGRLRVGEWVMAIGSPFGLDNTVTAGIVSAKQRDTGDFLPFIQTDVAVNPGNSGGPLINLRGEVVGINSQIYTRTGSFAGISFAIPIDEAMRVADQLRANGRVIRGRIGVQIAEVSKDVAESLGLQRAQGALVRSVEPNGPAASAGVEAGDIILRFDGRLIEKSSDLPRIVGGTKPGTRSTIQVLRRGQTRDLTVAVAEFEPDRPRRQASAEPPRPAPSQAGAAIGLTVADLTDAQKAQLKIKGGVRIEAVEGVGARAGLREGDVILAMANADVTDVKSFEAAVKALDRSKPVSVLFRRGEWTQYAVIRPSVR